MLSVEGHVDVISSSEISGWAIDWEQPDSVLDISIITDGSEVGRCKTDIERPGLRSALGDRSTGIHAFSYHFEQPLDIRDHHHIEVLTTQKGILLPNGRRTLYAPKGGHSRFTPILLTSCGRSGTTMLMQEFVAHPDIAIANAYPFEFKLASYYAAAWNVLSASTHTPTETELDFAAHSDRDMLIGRNPWNRPDLLESLGGGHVATLIGKSFPDRLADLFRGVVEENYNIVSEASGKSARFFAEKSTLEESVRESCRILFPTVREVVLVRDPRDYICSATQFWKQSISELFATMRIEYPLVLRIFAQHRPDILFVRYEDLVLNSANARRRLHDFIGSDPIASLGTTEADMVPDTHRTSMSAAASIGRFRTELDKHSQESCRDAFSLFMTTFDY